MDPVQFLNKETSETETPVCVCVESHLQNGANGTSGNRTQDSLSTSPRPAVARTMPAPAGLHTQQAHVFALCWESKDKSSSFAGIGQPASCFLQSLDKTENSGLQSRRDSSELWGHSHRSERKKKPDFLECGSPHGIL